MIRSFLNVKNKILMKNFNSLTKFHKFFSDNKSNSKINSENLTEGDSSINKSFSNSNLGILSRQNTNTFTNTNSNLNSNYFFKISQNATQTPTQNSQEQKKIIILKKSNLPLEENPLNFEAPRLPKEITKNWEHFFKKNTKIPLDINRAVNNFPDRIYKYFFIDMKETFNEKQLLFAIKNIFLHRESNTPWWNVFNNLKSFFNKEKFNKASKLNLMMLYEVAYLNSKEGATNKLFYGFFEKITDAIRFQANKLPIEEMIFVLNSLLKYKFYDAYLINLLFERFKLNDFREIVKNRNNYRIKYFGYEVKLAVPLINIFNKYVENCLLHGLEISEENKITIEKTFKEVRLVINKHIHTIFIILHIL